jgi:cellulose synthase/poly-beta-1,6-N-acetylglucosamine synthase-like glycosyltransferase
VITVASILLALLTFLYIIALSLVIAGLFRLPQPDNSAQPFISVVVAVRNEEHHILTLLQALTHQSYPVDQFEIIIVDDDSIDRTVSHIKTVKKNNPLHRIDILEVTDRHLAMSPKKNALAKGIAHASGDIILLTDADCVPPAGWIEGMTRYFTEKTGMVIGFSPYELPHLNSIQAYLFAIDSLSLAAISAGTCGLGFAATCNGRNLAYRKNVYEQVGGFRDIQQFVSGDDDLFLKLVKEKTDWHVKYAYDAQLAVPTFILTNFSQFIHQRIRHASKGFSYQYGEVVLLMLLYLYNLLLLILLPISIVNSFYIPIICFIVKIIVEFLLLFIFAHHMGHKKPLIAFPLALLFHVPYVVIFGALGQFASFQWKSGFVQK